MRSLLKAGAVPVICIAWLGYAWTGVDGSRVQEDASIRCRKIEIYDEEGRVKMSMTCDDGNPEIRFHKNDQENDITISSVTDGKIRISVGKNEPIELGLISSREHVVGIQIGTDNTASLGTGPIGAVLNLVSMKEGRLVHLHAMGSECQAIIGKALDENAGEKAKGVLISSSNVNDGVTIRGEHGRVACRMQMRANGESVIGVSNSSQKMLASMQSVEERLAIGISAQGEPEGLKRGFITVQSVDPAEKSAVMWVDSPENQSISERAGKAGFWIKGKRSTMALEDAEGYDRIRAISEGEKANVIVSDASGESIASLLYQEGMAGLVVGCIKGPLATLGVWRDRSRLKMTDKDSSERLKIEIDKEGHLILEGHTKEGEVRSLMDK